MQVGWPEVTGCLIPGFQKFLAQAWGEEPGSWEALENPSFLFLVWVLRPKQKKPLNTFEEHCNSFLWGKVQKGADKRR